MSRPYRIQNGEEWLRKAKRLKHPLMARITYRGQHVATLYNMERDELQERASRFVDMVGYRSASVSIVSQ